MFVCIFFFFFFKDTATTEIYTLSLHDALPISIETFTRLQRVEGEIVDELFNRLYDSSSIVAYTSAQTLSLMGRSEKTKPAHRQRILTALADAVRSPESRRGIYAIVGTGGDQSDRKSVV